MLSASKKQALDTFAAAPTFRLRTQGDTVFGDATGHRSRKLMSRGQLTPAGQYLQDERGVSFPRRAIDQTQRTYFRGRSEYTTTQDGREVKLRHLSRDCHDLLTKTGQLMVDSDDDPTYQIAVDYNVKTGVLAK